MADFTITISNSITMIGPSPINTWGNFDWGDNWGESGDVATDIGKNLSNSIALSDSLTKSGEKGIANSVAVTGEASAETIQTPNGYYRIFVGGVTDAEQRPSGSYTEQQTSTASFSQVSRPSTNWS